MAAGFMAGVTEALVIVTPFEVVKIRLQQQRGMSKELLKYKVRHCSRAHCHVTEGFASAALNVWWLCMLHEASAFGG